MHQHAEIVQKLTTAGIDNPRFEAKIILAYAEKNADANLNDIVQRRIAREPLQYILGSWEFYGYEFILNSACLIPRPETEFLVEAAIEHAPKNAKLLDLCTGSGCVAISILRRRPDITAVCADISTDAIIAATENARINGVSDRIKFITCDILSKDGESLIKSAIPDCNIITANPPYLTTNETDTAYLLGEELSHEPRIAFDGGTDGLDFYRKTADLYCNCYDFGNNIIVIFEVGAGQADSVAEIYKSKPLGFNAVKIQDYSKIDRVIILKRR